MLETGKYREFDISKDKLLIQKSINKINTRNMIVQAEMIGIGKTNSLLTCSIFKLNGLTIASYYDKTRIKTPAQPFLNECYALLVKISNNKLIMIPVTSLKGKKTD